MASLPADEDYARSVLAILSLRNIRAQESLALREVEALFLDQHMGRPADFEAALLHAASQGWLTRALDRVRLTALGAEEMQSVSWPLRGAPPQSLGPRPVRQRL
jgi:L-fucose isomerase-like protein